MEPIEHNEIYRQQYAHFGRMNDILYKLPVLFSSLIGALWYFAFTFLDKSLFVSAVVLAFAAVLSVIFALVVERFRLAFNGYIDNINKMDGPMKVTIKGGWSTMRLIQVSLGCAALLSVISLGFVFLTY